MLCCTTHRKHYLNTKPTLLTQIWEPKMVFKNYLHMLSLHFFFYSWVLSKHTAVTYYILLYILHLISALMVITSLTLVFSVSLIILKYTIRFPRKALLEPSSLHSCLWMAISILENQFGRSTNYLLLQEKTNPKPSGWKWFVRSHNSVGNFGRVQMLPVLSPGITDSAAPG